MTSGGGAVYDRGELFVLAADQSVWSLNLAQNEWKQRKVFFSLVIGVVVALFFGDFNVFCETLTNSEFYYR